MSLKELFGKTTEKVISNENLQQLYNQGESEEYVEEILKDKERFLPLVDFSNPANFAFYGSAEKYYVDSFKNIYQNYPYDGSKKEKQEWRNNVSQLDLYLFDEIYPKTVGHIELSGTNPTVVSNIRSASAPQYVTIKGGPNPSVDGKFETSNIYDLNTNRESNLGITQKGNTVEFWFKDNAISGTALSQAEYCLFDLSNGTLSGSDNYTRLTIAKAFNATENKFLVTYISGTSGIQSEVIDYDFEPYNWHHYAFTFKNSLNNADDLEVCLFVDGVLVKKQTILASGEINLSDNSNIVANLGSYRAELNGNINSGLGCSFGSFDEFRFWKVARSSQQIYRNWFTQVGGGTNKDDANVNLGVYLKFNEGIVNDNEINSLDAICLDYSGRVSNGNIINYNIYNKKTTSAIDIYFNKEKEARDVIIIPSNPLVTSTIENYREQGFQYDQTNSSNIYKTIPAWITEEAEKKDLPDLQQLIQIIASYFDALYLQIKALPSIKNVDYATDGVKPKPFSKNLLNSNGFENLEIFNDTTFLESVLSRNEKEEFSEKIHNVKNTIYQNIYNNLPYIYKSKGTEKSLRNFIRCFGIDDELIKINLYANNAEYDLTNKYIYSSIPKKFVDFNNADRYTGYIYQKAKSGNPDTLAFIPFNYSSNWHYVPLTIQAEVIFPKNPIIESNRYALNDFVSSSLYGVHTAMGDPNDFSWGVDEFNFQVYSVRTTVGSPDAYFFITGGFNGYSVSLSTDVFKDVYDNQKWNFAVRVKPEKYNINFGSGSTETDYILEFVGFNSIGDSVNNSFSISTTVPEADMKLALEANKRVYAGAHYTDFDRTRLENKTDVKISSVRFWVDYITDEELLAHSYEAGNFGRLQPNWPPAYLLSLSGAISTSAFITKIDTLALNWSFFNVTASDNNGQFIVDDVSSGSVEAASYYGLDWLSAATKYQMPGFADRFFANDDQVVNKEFVFSSKKQNPETLNGNDLVQILNTDDVTRTKDSRLISYYISVEKSMAQVLNDEIMNWFATIKSYNNLIGEPVQRYKQEYSGLNHLRELFFSKVNNSINFEKFFEFYKWIDSSLSMMINQLIPASANASDKVRNIVESHMLERSKYTNQLPTIEFKGQPEYASIEPYTFSANKLNSLEDTITPVNIENSLITSQFIFASASITGSGQIVQPIKKKGNYYHSYEYLFTSGRTTNNKSFIDLEGNISGTTAAVGVAGFTDRALPIRSVNKQIIVERFSAPGGPEINSRGAMDTAAEEYSVYNSLNYRNSRVRKVLNVWSAESASIDPENPSYHKVNKNPTYIPISETSSLTEPYYDNDFVQHVIPRSEAQYAWITASLAVKPSASGYITNYDNLNYDYEFLSASSFLSFTNIPFVNFRYFGDIEYDVVLTDKIYDTASNTILGGTSTGLFGTFYHTHFFLTSLNGPYQYPSWKQIRNSENPLSILSRKNNNILLQNVRKENINGKDASFLNPDEPLFTSFKEPPVSFNRPMTQKINISGSVDSIDLVDTYDNNKERFANKDLAVKTGISERDELQTYDVLFSLDKNGTFEPRPQIVEAKYTTQIYPAKENTGLKEVRTKPYYDDFGSTASVTDIRSYWSDNYNIRKRAVETIDLFNYTTTSYAALTDFTGSIMGKYPVLHKISGNINASIYALDNLTGSTTEYTATIINERDMRDMGAINSQMSMSLEYKNIHGILSPYSLAEHRFNILDPDHNLQDLSYLAMWNVNSQSWSPGYDVYGGPIPRLNGEIFSLYYDNNTNRLYAGGTFTADEYGNILNCFAYFDGRDWNTVNGGVGRVGLMPAVHDIISGSDGIYIAGSFATSSFGTGLNNIARYDGSNLVALAAGLNDQGFCLLSGASGLYVGGIFTQAGGILVNKIAKWNGLAWSGLGTGTGIGVQIGWVNSLATYTGSYIAVGGVFNNVSGSSISTKGLALYNTSSNVWEASFAGGLKYNNTLPGYVFNIVKQNNDLLMCGVFEETADSSKKLNNFARYKEDGTWGTILNKDVVFDIDKEYTNDIFPYTLYYDQASNILYTGLLSDNTILRKEYNTFAFDLNNQKLIGFQIGLNNFCYSITSNPSMPNTFYFGGGFTRQNTRAYLKTKQYNTNVFEGYQYNTKRLPPRPTLVFNNHLISSTGSNSYLEPAGLRGMLINDLNSDSTQKTTTYGLSYPEALYFINDGYVYDTRETAGTVSINNVVYDKKPNFNSYEEYLEDLKPNSINYSIVPEYRISDYMEYYIKEKSGNFLSVLTASYLAIDGAAIENDFSDINSTLNSSNVLNTFLLEDKMSFEGAFDKETIINFNISAIKKLLPYDGFYPSERIKQLSSKFINSFLDLKQEYVSVYNDIEVRVDGNTTNLYNNVKNGTPIDQQILTLIQPLFAPGVLLNTIKSSIAVDWPAFITNSVGYSASIPPSFYSSSGSVTTNHTATLFIDEEPNYRFNFESLLEFDTLIPSNLKTTSSNLYYLDPTYYSTDITSGSDRQYLRYPSYNMSKSGSLKDFSFNNPDYKLAMHNFLAEIPNFFLKNGLSKFVSAPEDKFVNAVSGVTYYMDVILERDLSKHKEYVMDTFYQSAKNDVDIQASGNILTFSPDSLYGPPVRYWNNINASALTSSGWNNLFFKQIDSPAYAPYVPPYYYGKSIARIAFTADDNRQYSLGEIQENSVITYINEGAELLFAQRSNYISSSFSTPYSDNYSDSPSYKQLMTLSSSINLKLKTETFEPEYDAANSAFARVKRPFSINNAWVIQTKFETPSLNFIDVDRTNNLGLKFLGGNKNETYGFVEGIYTNLFKGLWTTYGRATLENEGIKLYITDYGSNSLADLCGFKKDETRTIGLLDNNKKISEGIVIIPYTKTKNHGKNINELYASTIKPIKGENITTEKNNNVFYYELDRNILKDVIGLSFSEDSKVTFEEIKNKVNSNDVDQNNSIVKLIRGMTKYSIPPHLDWVRNKKINPFVMYVAEFDAVLDTEDLADIWQGIMPKSSYQAEKDEINITHNFAKTELFHGKKLQNDIKFKIFKVKQKAEINYYKLTDDNRDDTRFNFTFNNSSKASRPEYSYNWPYDYFSLIELVNVEASLKVKPAAPIVQTVVTQQTQVEPSRQPTLTTQEARRQTEATKEEPSIGTLKNTRV